MNTISLFSITPLQLGIGYNVDPDKFSNKTGLHHFISPVCHGLCQLGALGFNHRRITVVSSVCLVIDVVTSCKATSYDLLLDLIESSHLD